MKIESQNMKRKKLKLICTFCGCVKIVHCYTLKKKYKYIALLAEVLYRNSTLLTAQKGRSAEAQHIITVHKYCTIQNSTVQNAL